MHFRSCISVLLGAAAVLLAVVCLPAAAGAQGMISISSVTFTNGNPDVLTVTADDANELAIETMTVDFCPSSVSTCSDSTPPVLQLPMVAESQSDTSQQTFDLTIPEGGSQGELLPGTYSMAFDATDADETDSGLTAPDQADLAFVYTGVAVTATATPISYNNAVTISGQVTGVLPGASQASGIDSVPVVLDDLTNSTETQIATSAPDGTFSGQATLVPTDQYDVEVMENQSWGSASVSLPTSVDEDTTSVSAQVTPEDFVYGSKVKATLTGTASYESDGQLEPLGDYPVEVTTGDSKTSLTTNSNGQFSLTYPPSDGAAWSVLVGDGVLLAQSQATGTIHVQVPLSVKSFSASLSTRELVTVSGCVAVTVPGFSAPDGIVIVQYSKGRYGPWQFLSWGQMTVAGGPSCHGDDRSYFTVTQLMPSASAYYRAYVPSTANYLSAESRAVYRWKYFTQIASVSVSPLTVARNGKITVSGQLEVWLSRWRDYGKQKVWIVIRLPGPTYYWLRKNIKANADGRFKASTKARDGWPNGALVSAYFPGNSTHFEAIGKLYCIRVRGAPDLCPKNVRQQAVTEVPKQPA